jgi:hypothetical protein
MNRNIIPILLICTALFSCKSESFITDYNNINDPESEVYKPPVPSSITITGIDEKSIKLSWLFDYTLFSNTADVEKTVSYIVEKGDSGKNNFIILDTVKSAVVLANKSKKITLEKNIKASFTLNEVFSIRIRSLRNGKQSPNSDTLCGKVFLGAPANFRVTYDPYTKRMFLGWDDIWNLYSNNNIVGWNCRQGYKIYARKADSGDEFRLINTTIDPVHNSRTFAEVTDLSGFTTGLEYEFEICAYLNSLQSPFIKTKILLSTN